MRWKRQPTVSRKPLPIRRPFIKNNYMVHRLDPDRQEKPANRELAGGIGFLQEPVDDEDLYFVADIREPLGTWCKGK